MGVHPIDLLQTLGHVLENVDDLGNIVDVNTDDRLAVMLQLLHRIVELFDETVGASHRDIVGTAQRLDLLDRILHTADVLLDVIQNVDLLVRVCRGQSRVAFHRILIRFAFQRDLAPSIATIGDTLVHRGNSLVGRLNLLAHRSQITQSVGQLDFRGYFTFINVPKNTFQIGVIATNLNILDDAIILDTPFRRTPTRHVNVRRHTNIEIVIGVPGELTAEFFAKTLGVRININSNGTGEILHHKNPCFSITCPETPSSTRSWRKHAYQRHRRREGA